MGLPFIDEAQITVSAGKGGDGRASFRREAQAAKGGPDGGDGGRGGSIYLEADHNCSSLAPFRARYQFKAENGADGGTTDCTGKSGDDLMIAVPVGTVILNDNGERIGELLGHGERMCAAVGGDGGLGNIHFKSPVNRTPRRCTKGFPGDSKKLMLELALLGDVGLVGLPNAGKSTFLAAATNARPKIADYPFTTLSPNLGICDLDIERSLLIADIPGLIEGAADGAGLGHRFLKHVRRTTLLLILLDSTETSEQVVQAYHTLLQELEAFDKSLLEKPRLLVLNKIDAVDSGKIEELENALPSTEKILAISAVAQTGVKILLENAWRLHQQEINEEM